jgi:hypothetical protein
MQNDSCIHRPGASASLLRSAPHFDAFLKRHMICGQERLSSRFDGLSKTPRRAAYVSQKSTVLMEGAFDVQIAGRPYRRHHRSK